MTSSHMLTPDNTSIPISSEQSLLSKKLALTHISPPTMEVDPKHLLKIKRRMIGALVGALKTATVFEHSLIKAAIKHQWGKAISFEFFSISGNRFITKFSNDKDKDWVMRNHPWPILGALLLEKEIRDGDDAGEMPLNELPLWLEFRDLKTEHLDWRIIRAIGAQIGNVDPNTPKKGIIPGDEELKLLVTMKIDCPLPSITPAITERGDFTLIRVNYLGITQPFCTFCVEFGHSTETCEVKNNVLKAIEQQNAGEQDNLEFNGQDTTAVFQPIIQPCAQENRAESSSNMRVLGSKAELTAAHVSPPGRETSLQLPGVQVTPETAVQNQTELPPSLDTVGLGLVPLVANSEPTPAPNIGLSSIACSGTRTQASDFDMMFCDLEERTILRGSSSRFPGTEIPPLPNSLMSSEALVLDSANIPYWLNSPTPAVNQLGIALPCQGAHNTEQVLIGPQLSPGLTISGHGMATPSLENQTNSRLDPSLQQGDDHALLPNSTNQLALDNAEAGAPIVDNNFAHQTQYISSDHNSSNGTRETREMVDRNARVEDTQNSQYDPIELPINPGSQSQTQSGTNSVNQVTNVRATQHRRRITRSIHQTETRRIQTRSSSSGRSSGRSRTRPRRG